MPSTGRYGLFVFCLALSEALAAECGPYLAVPAEHSRLSVNHHLVGKGMPAEPTFNQPDSCSEGIWFYDLNRNGLADPGEPRLYGSERFVACGSCHAESPDAATAESASVFLRQDARTLCLVCHNQ